MVVEAFKKVALGMVQSSNEQIMQFFEKLSSVYVRQQTLQPKEPLDCHFDLKIFKQDTVKRVSL